MFTQAIQIHGKDIHRGKGFSVCDNVQKFSHVAYQRNEKHFVPNDNLIHSCMPSEESAIDDSQQSQPTSSSQNAQEASTGSSNTSKIQHISQIHIVQIEDIWKSTAAQEILLGNSIVR